MNRTNLFSIGPKVTAVLASGLCAMLASASAFAQSEEPTVSPEQSAAPNAASSQEEKIDKFADAYVVIQEIETQAVTQLEAAESAETAYAIKAKAEGQIVEAVERSGLKFEEFTRIAKLASIDEALRMKIADKVEQRRRI
jgi:hypothetical protein